MSDNDINVTESSRLAELLRDSGANDYLWGPQELGEILQHQLSVPIEFDLGALQRGAARKLRTTATAHGLLLSSFRDLLHHPNPTRSLFEESLKLLPGC